MFKLELTIPHDDTAKLKKALAALAKKELLVGFPEGGPARPGQLLGNPDLAYLNETGSAAQNRPPRPFLVPGLETVREELTEHLTGAVTAALEGDAAGLDRGYHKAGLQAVRGIRNYITAGVPPPLALSTLANRRRAGLRGTKPLIASGQMFRALTYVVKDRK